MNKIVIVGAGGHANSCIDVIEEEGRFKIIGLIDNNINSNKTITKYKIIGNDSDLNFKVGDTGTGALKFLDGNATQRGRVYWDGSSDGKKEGRREISIGRVSKVIEEINLSILNGESFSVSSLKPNSLYI